MVSASTPFSDIQNHWARSFIEALAQRGIVSGLPDRTFRPNNSMTRAEYATVIAKAFPRPKKRQYVPFVDVPATYWAASSIQKAYETGFISGFPDNIFLPEERISRLQVLLSLVSGLELASTVQPDLIPVLPQLYQDAAAITSWALDEVAVATRAGLVASHPNTKILNPNLAATRADVAVMVYQGLVYLKQAPAIASSYLIVPPAPGTITVSVSHRREFRGVWVTSVWNSDWPSKQGLSVEQQKAELIGILDRVRAMNFNAVVLQIRTEGDALYPSQLEPWSHWLTGTQGQAPNPLYDPLEFAIAECRKRHLELHAWFNPYRAKTSTKSGANVSPHIAITNPEYVYQWGNQLWMDPGAKVVQDKTYNVILDVVRRYDIDGVHLDDYFYPYPILGQSFPDNKTYAAYKASGGKLSLEDWRRENINLLVQRLWTGIKATKPHVKFGISPFGIYRPGQPPQIQGLDSYNELYTDSKKWLEQGWLDYFSPQLYWRTNQTAQSYPVLLNWWVEQNPQKRHIYVGNKVDTVDDRNRTVEEIEKQIEITRSLVGKMSLGNIFFTMIAFTENRQGIYDKFKTSTYANLALVPAMPWVETTPPSVPTGIAVQNRQLTWRAVDDRDIRAWVLYKQIGTTWALLQIFPGAIRAVTLEPGTYALSAVDRMANESAGAVVLVS